MLKYSLLVFLFISCVYSAINNDYARATLKKIGTSTIDNVAVSIAYSTDNTEGQLYVSNFPNSNNNSYVFVILNHGDLTKAPSYNDLYNPNNAPTNCLKNGFLGNTDTSNPLFIKSDFVLSDSYSVIGLAIVIFEGSDFSCNPKLNQQADVPNIGKAVSSGLIGIGNLNISTVPDSDPFYSLNKSLPSGAADKIMPGTSFSAICQLESTPASKDNISGIVYFDTNNGATEITVSAQINGLQLGSIHGIHIHTFGDLSLPETSVGGHWKTAGQTHALPNNGTREYGDLGNICYYYGKTAYYKFTTNYFPITGQSTILGRSVVVHELRDNGTTFGARVAWCTIGLRLGETSPFKIPSQINIASPPVCVSSTVVEEVEEEEPSTGSFIQISIIFLVSTLLVILI